jgi:hypothetical protein
MVHYEHASVPAFVRTRDLLRDGHIIARSCQGVKLNQVDSPT